VTAPGRRFWIATGGLGNLKVLHSAMAEGERTGSALSASGCHHSMSMSIRTLKFFGAAFQAR